MVQAAIREPVSGYRRSKERGTGNFPHFDVNNRDDPGGEAARACNLSISMLSSPMLLPTRDEWRRRYPISSEPSI